MCGPNSASRGALEPPRRALSIRGLRSAPGRLLLKLRSKIRQTAQLERSSYPPNGIPRRPSEGPPCEPSQRRPRPCSTLLSELDEKQPPVIVSSSSTSHSQSTNSDQPRLFLKIPAGGAPLRGRPPQLRDRGASRRKERNSASIQSDRSPRGKGRPLRASPAGPRGSATGGIHDVT